MARSLSAGMITEVTAKSLSPILLMKAEFDSGDLNLWTGIGSLTYNGDTYVGAGNLIGVSAVKESIGVEAHGVNFSLSGLPTSLISLALTEDYQGRAASCWFAALDSAGALVSSPYLLFKGRMDVLEILEGGETATLTMRCENLLIDFRRQKTRRYSDDDQKEAYSTDRGLEFVDQMQDREIIWGVKTPAGSGNK